MSFAFKNAYASAASVLLLGVIVALISDCGGTDEFSFDPLPDAIAGGGMAGAEDASRSEPPVEGGPGPISEASAADASDVVDSRSPDPCEGITCSGHGRCDPTGDVATCFCFSGYFPHGPTCEDVDECTIDHGGCDPLTTCTNTPGSHECGACPAGYTGTGAQGCTDIDECKTGGGCGANAQCENTKGARNCLCRPGFTGDPLTGCTDIDECAKNNGKCGANSTCQNTQGARSCLCKPGFTGDPLAGCTDIDECAKNNGGCDVLTTCTNTVGSRVCGVCPLGYTGAGATGCQDIDECAVNNGGCGFNTDCVNTPGSRMCPCKAGFVNNGFGCVPIFGWN